MDVVIVDQFAAARLFPGRQPHRTGANPSGGSPGVVYTHLNESLNLKELDGMLGIRLVVKTAIEPARLERTLRHAVLAVAPGMAVLQIQTIDDQVMKEYLIPQVSAAAFGFLGATGLIFSAIGLSGVPATVARTVVKESLVLAGVGLAIGTPLPLGLAKLLTGRRPTSSSTA